MPKPKSDTVGSYVQHGEVLRMSVDWRHPVDRPGERDMRWSCSCGRRGTWLPEGPYRKASLAFLWNDHVQRIHPDYDL